MCEAFLHTTKRAYFLPLWMLHCSDKNGYNKWILVLSEILTFMKKNNYAGS